MDDATAKREQGAGGSGSDSPSGSEADDSGVPSSGDGTGGTDPSVAKEGGAKGSAGTPGTTDGNDGDGTTGATGTNDGSGQPGDPGRAGSGGTADASRTGSGKGTSGTGGDGEFDKALQDFDGTILTERGTIAARAVENAGSGTDDEAGSAGGSDRSKSGGVPGGASGGSGGTADGRAAGGTTGGGGGGMPDVVGGPTGSGLPAPPMPSTRNAEVASMPSDVADARDDDVVARQLREAATAETDPVLKEKLWEEYRQYKAGK